MEIQNFLKQQKGQALKPLLDKYFTKQAVKKYRKIQKI
jgi:hypothetical protein